VAEIIVQEHYSPDLLPRTSDSLFGRFDRLLLPGEYSLEISKDGYETEYMTNLEVREGQKTPIDVQLTPSSTSKWDVYYVQKGTNLLVNTIYPNPFRNEVNIDFTLYERTPVTIRLTDLLGKQIAITKQDNLTTGQHQINWRPERSLTNLESGVYFLTFETSKARITKRVMKHQ